MTDLRDNKGILLQAGTNEVEFLLFTLGGQRYGLNVGKVCQILMYDESKISPLPQRSPEVLGLTLFRERTISVVDLKQHLGIESENSAKRIMLATEFNERITGFVIDGVERIERCSWDQFVPIAAQSSDDSAESILGSINLQDSIVLILDFESIMARIDPSMSMEAHSQRISSGEGTGREGLTIVSCEDSPIIQKMLVKMLEKAGIRNCHVFSDGAEGLKALTSNPNFQVDLIISDIEMPNMDGLTFCKKVKELPQYCKVPFIFFSSMINEQMREKCRSVGGDLSFSKPQIDMIVNAIDMLIGQKAKLKKASEQVKEGARPA